MIQQKPSGLLRPSLEAGSSSAASMHFSSPGARPPRGAQDRLPHSPPTPEMSYLPHSSDPLGC
jgi:hypothetical protein